MTYKVSDALRVVVGIVAGVIAATMIALIVVIIGRAARMPAHTNATEPMAVSTLPDGTRLCTYVHVDPDTGKQLYVTSAGGIWPRDAGARPMDGSTAGANAVTLEELEASGAGA